MGFTILIFCALFAYLAYRKLDWAIYLIVAFLPSYLIRFSILSIPFTLLEAMIIIAFLVFLFKYKLSWLREFRKNQFFWPIAAIFTIATISMLVSPNLRGAAGIWRAYFIEPMMLYAVLITLIKSKRQLHNIFWALGLSVTYISVVAIWQMFSGWNVPDAFLNINGTVDRAVSIFGYPNAIGLYFAPIIILFTGFLFVIPAKAGISSSVISTKVEKSLKLLILSIIILGFIIIILAESEAALLSILAIWLLWGIINKKTRYYFATLVIILIIFFIFVSPVSSYLSEKLLLQDYSGSIRLLIWQETWEMLQDNWLLGAGLAGYQTKIAAYHLPTFEIFLYPHNIIFNFWSELGLLGLTSFIWLTLLFLWKNIVEILRNSSQSTKILHLTLIFVTLQMLIHGIVDVPYFKNDLSILFWLIIAIYTISKNINHGEVAESG